MIGKVVSFTGFQMKDDEKLVFKFLSFLLPATYVPIGIPLALKLIPPGGAYGFRTKTTLANSDVWYSVNFIGGFSLVVAGLLSLSLIYLLHRNSTGSFAKLIVSYAISILFLIIAIIFAFCLG